jgi:phosphoribosylformylglycinamidine cyclo-ligase
MGKLVLSPTRTYAPIIKEILKAHRRHIDGMVHCSGGAQTKVLHFVDNMHIIKDNLFPVPPLFRIIQEQSHTSWEEMYKVFNMGHRLEIYVRPEIAADIIAIATHFNVEAQIIGRCEAATSKKLTIRSEAGEYVY